jgi:methyl-accepting chemotaxis protein
MKHTRLRIPIALRVGGVIGSVVVAFVVFMSTYFPARQNDRDREALEAKARILMKMTSYQLASALDFDDDQAVADIFKSLAVDPEFVFAALYDANGQQTATFTSPSGEGQAAKSLVNRMKTLSLDAPASSVWLQVQEPIVTPAGRRALVLSGFSYQVVRRNHEETRRAAFVVAVVMLLGGMLVAYLFGRSLGRRLSALSRVARDVAEGRLTATAIGDETDDEIGDMVESFNAMNRNLSELAARVNQIADGDLSNTVTLQGDLAAAFNRMIVSQRQLVSQIAATAMQLNSASGEFFSSAKQQERGATSQSAAVEQIRHTLQSLLESARQIGGAANDVLVNAERTQGNSQVVAEKIAALSTHNRRIAEVLEVIKDIANKSELLALNAGLEGTKAGEAGRGFSLVAAQMQRLAENVMGSVRTIKELTTTITESTETTVLSTEESTKLAANTTRSARQIGLIIQQQQSGTEQATSAMVDVGEVAGQTSAGSKAIVSSASDLMRLSEHMQGLVGKFKLNNAA